MGKQKKTIAYRLKFKKSKILVTEVFFILIGCANGNKSKIKKKKKFNFIFYIR